MSNADRARTRNPSRDCFGLVDGQERAWSGIGNPDVGGRVDRNSTDLPTHRPALGRSFNGARRRTSEMGGVI